MCLWYNYESFVSCYKPFYTIWSKFYTVVRRILKTFSREVCCSKSIKWSLKVVVGHAKRVTMQKLDVLDIHQLSSRLNLYFEQPYRILGKAYRNEKKQLNRIKHRKSYLNHDFIQGMFNLKFKLLLHFQIWIYIDISANIGHQIQRPTLGP